jgi:DNA-binding LytR/AlgR family response regulator
MSDCTSRALSPGGSLKEKMARVLLIDDEDAAARRLEQLLHEVEPGMEILPPLNSVKSAVAWLQENPPPDLILLDALLPDGQAFEIFEQVKIDCPVIFVTSTSEFAIRAFRVDAVDYLIKPLRQEDLEHALDKYKKTANAFSSLLEGKKHNHISRILIRFGQTIRLIETSDIAYFYTRNKLTFVVTQSTQKRIPVDYSLDKLETLLDPSLFFRVNRQLIVHISAIREMFSGAKSRILILLEPTLDQEAVVSSERSGLFKKWLVGETV